MNKVIIDIKRFFLPLTGGNVVAQLVALSLYPVLGYFYAPEAFGLRSLFVAWVSVCLPLTTFQYEVGIPLPKEDGEGASLVYKAVSTTFFTIPPLSLASYVVIYWKFPELKPYFFLLVATLFLSSWHAVFFHWAIRKAHFHLISRVRIVRAFLKGSIEFGGIWIGRWPLFLVLGWIVGSIGGLIPFFRKYKKEIQHLDAFKGERLRQKGEQVAGNKSHRLFPLYMMPAQWVYQWNQQFLYFFFPLYFSLEFSGQLAIAMLLAAIPSTVLVDAFSQVFSSRTASLYAHKDRTLYGYVYWSFYIILGTGLLVGGGIWAFGGLVIDFILGEKWGVAASWTPLVGALAPSYFLYAFSFHLLNLLGEQRLILGFNILKGILLISGAFFDFFRNDPWEALLFYVMVVNIVNFLQCVGGLMMINRKSS